MLELLDHIELGQFANEVNALKLDQVEFQKRLNVQDVEQEQRLSSYKSQFEREEEDLRRRLADELETVQKLSAKKIVKAQEYAKTMGNVPRGPTKPTEVAPYPTTAPMDPQQRVVEFWKMKHTECAAELAHIQSQVLTYRSKIHDIREAMDGDPSKLRCSVAAVRDRLLQERARTQEYRRLLDQIRANGSTANRAQKIVQTRAGAQNGDGSNETALTVELAHEDKRYLEKVEGILMILFEQRRNFVRLIEKRKAQLMEMIAFFNAPFDEAMLEGISLKSPTDSVASDSHSALPPTITETDDAETLSLLAFEGPPSLAPELNELTTRYNNLQESYQRNKREKRVSMIRQMDDGMMNRWIERIHLTERAKVMGTHIDAATRDKASLLFQIDQLATSAKAAKAFGKRL